MVFLLITNLGCSKIEYSTVEYTKFDEITKIITCNYKKGDTLTFKCYENNQQIKIIIDQIKIDEYRAKNGYYAVRSPSNHKILTIFVKILDENIRTSILSPFISIRGFPKDFDQEEEYSATLELFDFYETLINYKDLNKMKSVDTITNSKTVNELGLKNKNINNVVWKKDKGLIAFKSKELYFYLLNPNSAKSSK